MELEIVEGINYVKVKVGNWNYKQLINKAPLNGDLTVEEDGNTYVFFKDY